MKANARRAPWTVRVFELVAEGPRDLNDVIDDAMRWVPEGHAWRRHEYHLRWMQEAKGWTPRDVGRSDRDYVRMGARRVVRHTITSAVRGGYLVRVGDVIQLPEQEAKP